MSPPAAWVDCGLATDNWHSEFACAEVHGAIAEEDSGCQELAAAVRIETDHALVPLATRHCEASVQKRTEEDSVVAGTCLGQYLTDCTPHLWYRMLGHQHTLVHLVMRHCKTSVLKRTVGSVAVGTSLGYCSIDFGPHPYP